MNKILVVLLLFGRILHAQTDYGQLSNWHVHPEQAINILAAYNLDIAVIDKALDVESVIEIENRSTSNTGVDVFFVHPTQLSDFPISPGVVPIVEQPSFLILGTILAQGGLLSSYGRFYAPKYRQATPSSFVSGFFSDAERAAALITAYSDIKAAFIHYLEHHNNGNRIILAGHSQGSFLLGMLLRDVFDDNEALRTKLVTAALGGMRLVYAPSGEFQGGWWENIPLCTTVDECGCIHNWASYKEDQAIPEANTALPPFNQILVDSGYVYRAIDDDDWIIQDSLIYGSTASPLRYYIAPDASYDLGGAANFIAFDSLYSARLRRASKTQAVLSVNYTDDPSDERPNDLLSQEEHPNYSNWGFHVKDYHLYLWALMEQINRKLAGCAMTTATEQPAHLQEPFAVYPNPNEGVFRIQLHGDCSSVSEEEVRIFDVYGRLVKTTVVTACEAEVKMETKGVYWLVSKYGSQKVVVN